MAATDFDLVFVGGGPAGYVGAIRASQLGLKTAVIEKRKTLGGTCLNVGCIPSKALLDSSEHFYFAKTKAEKHGIKLGDVKLDLGTLIKRKDGVVDQLTRGIDGLMRKHKIERIEGKGKLIKTGPDGTQVQIEGASTGPKTISAKNVVLATGSEVAELPNIPFDGRNIISSTEALSLSSVPKHLVVVGGGYIGLEMGSVWARLGSKVTVLEFMDRMLPMCDAQVVRELHKSLTKQGLDIKLSTKCLGVEGKTPKLSVRIEEKDKGVSTLECDLVLVCAGRRPFTDDLGCENVGVKVDAKGKVEIDSHFKTSTANIYAVGDIVRGPMLAHKAEEEGVAVAEVIAGKAGHVNYDVIPSVVYTWPELAMVGKTEEELKSAGVSYKIGTFPFLANGRAKAMDEAEGLVKVIADSKTDKVLGVHIFGPRASDVIAEAATIMEFGGSAEDLYRTCHGHPTLSEALREAALATDKLQRNL